MIREAALDILDKYELAYYIFAACLWLYIICIFRLVIFCGKLKDGCKEMRKLND